MCWNWDKYFTESTFTLKTLILFERRQKYSNKGKSAFALNTQTWNLFLFLFNCVKQTAYQYKREWILIETTLSRLFFKTKMIEEQLKVKLLKHSN